MYWPLGGFSVNLKMTKAVFCNVYTLQGITSCSVSRNAAAAVLRHLEEDLDGVDGWDFTTQKWDFPKLPVVSPIRYACLKLEFYLEDSTNLRLLQAAWCHVTKGD